jgi:alkylation response protein AidB-like acyl-CoA dehydrogenase
MYIGYDQEQEELRTELSQYYAKLLTPDVRARLAEEGGTGPTNREVVGQIGDDGWLGIGWPEEYGGQGRSAVEQFLFFDESMRSAAPIPMLTINTVGPTLMQFGTDEQKDFFLPKIVKGKLNFCIGYSEPDAGTDLFALTTRAVKDGDEYIINGQKTWTSLAVGADYIWLAARTNPDVKKQKGISLFCIPMDTPGITVEPLDLLSSHNINHTFFDDCRVPASTMVGEENQGFRLITSQLNRERVTLCSSGIVERLLEQTRTWAQETKMADGRRVIDQAWVRRTLAEVTAKVEFLRLINWKVAWSVAQGALDVADSSSIKVFGTEFYVDSFRKVMEIFGSQSYIEDGSPDHVTHLAAQWRSMIILTFGGGTNEMQRDLISQFGVGLPRADR